ncbi:MAG TPA: class I adenylate-forming enzyme family protein [Candidatus Dormibacteraeota bacterium]|nr:class I adenylate-forming enzyme family protein [Candidatus Dormibacteraeota bacterium]
MLTLAALPWVAAHRDAEAALLRLEGAALTASALDRAAAGIAAWLERQGVGAGHRVGVLCGNGLAFPPLYYGALRRGCVVAPLSTSSPPAEVARVLRAVRARVLACDSENAGPATAALELAGTGARRLVISEVTAGTPPGPDLLDLASLVEHPPADPPPLPPGAPAVILATSGTTGTPRRALHSHAGLLLNAGAVATEMLGLSPADVQLGALPLAHSFGMSAVLNASLLAGASVRLVRRPGVAELRRLLGAGEVTVVQAVPTLLDRLAEASTAPWAGVRLCVVSGAPLPEGLPARIHRCLAGRLLERYGMTEVSPLTVREVPAGGGEPGDVGLPLRGVMVRVARGGAEGELEAAAPSMFLRYDGHRRATAEVLQGGLLRTGDLGRVGPGGRVTVTGRLKEVIVRGGNNVAAREVERLLESHPAVAEAAVLGMPDADLGEEVAAALVLRPRTPGDVVAELERLCREQLAQYKRPRLWHVLESLPRTASGKVRKGELRELLIERSPR